MNAGMEAGIPMVLREMISRWKAVLLQYVMYMMHFEASDPIKTRLITKRHAGEYWKVMTGHFLQILIPTYWMPLRNFVMISGTYMTEQIMLYHSSSFTFIDSSSAE